MATRLVQAATEDAAILCELSRTTFFESFAADNTAENMQRYMDAAFTPEKMRQELNDTGSRFYFAYCDHSIAGYIKINTGAAQTELKTADSLEVERIYVLRHFQSKGIGQALLDKAIALAKKESKKNIWLGVWEKNVHAIRFYTRNGFIRFGDHPFIVGTDVQTDILMKLSL